MLCDPYFFVSLDHTPDPVRLPQMLSERVHIRFSTDHDHSNTHIKCPEHFTVLNITEPLHKAKDCRLGPGTSFYFNSYTLGKNTRNIFKKAAPGNMNETLDKTFIQ